MRQVESYTVVLAQDSVELVIQVNNYIKAGWQPLGALTAYNTGLVQAMVKYQESLTGLGGAV